MNMQQKLKIAQFGAFSDELRKIAGVTPLPALQRLVRPKAVGQIAGAAGHTGQAGTAIGRAGHIVGPAGGASSRVPGVQGVSPASDPRAMGLRAQQLQAAAEKLESNYSKLRARTVRLSPETWSNAAAKQQAAAEGLPQRWMTR